GTPSANPTDVSNTTTRLKTLTRQVPTRTKAASGIKEFAIFFILCSYLKASQNTRVSVKENKEKSIRSPLAGDQVQTLFPSLTLRKQAFLQWFLLLRTRGGGIF